MGRERREGRGKEGTEKEGRGKGREGKGGRKEEGEGREVEEGGRCPPNADSWIRPWSCWQRCAGIRDLL